MGVMNSLSIFVCEGDHWFVRGPCSLWLSRKLDALHYLQVCFLGLGWLACRTSPYNDSYFSERWSWWFFHLPFHFLVPVISSNFPCLMRFSICCFKSKHSSVSWPWFLWKRQYLFLLRLLGSPLIFSGHFKEGSSLICLMTCLIGMFKEVYCWFRAEEPDFLVSQSFLSSVRPFFRRGPYSEWRLGFASTLSDLFLFLAMITSSAFIKFWAEWTSSAMD